MRFVDCYLAERRATLRKPPAKTRLSARSNFPVIPAVAVTSTIYPLEYSARAAAIGVTVTATLFSRPVRLHLGNFMGRAVMGITRIAGPGRR